MGNATVVVNGVTVAWFSDSKLTGHTGQEQAEAYLDEFAETMAREGKHVRVRKVR